MGTPRRPASFTLACAAFTVAMALPAPAVQAAAHRTPGGTATLAEPDGPCPPPTRFRPQRFDDSADLDNAHQPLPAGTEITLQAVANDGGAPLPHVVVLTATDLVKKINGVWTRVLWQRDRRDGAVVESALVFQAQDGDGNVWQLGSTPN